MIVYVNNLDVPVLSSLPGAAQDKVTGQWVMSLALATPAQQEGCGYFTLADIAMPAPVAGKNWLIVLTIVNSRPVATWTQFDKSPEEIARDTRIANRELITLSATIVTKLAELETFFVDADVVTAQNQTNNTALSAAQQNRFNKALITEMRRLKNMVTRLARYTGASDLLDNVSDV